MKKIKIKMVKSKNKRSLRQKRTFEALGLRKLNHTVELTDTPQIRGMITKLGDALIVTNS